MNKLETAFALFDKYNKTDPNIFTWNGIACPQEYFLAIKLYQWVLKLDPAASEELLLASRSQHIGRWEIPRESYPEGREAYLQWRKNLAIHHAGVASDILRRVGYTDVQVERVKQIILKQRIKTDAEVQVIENALCLVFLEFQYEDFYPKHEPDKVINILKRSLLKMDADGHAFALTLSYSEKGLFYINEALKLITR
ncbi:DUF4202 domain-containing protein [Mucilaginibacter terrigena]|uniref:DUF4202 domain-containing protein n=1 Tax=Mucilaginibacter terrigena TaxID=2492395 RepID=A0A4Q5LQN0_9SPHI|nr:DUF4202 domain-containing protein [Mucilaginibacter terrigena]RYU91659.1 DUF4202 domain-containing protein [Mucilaginibacter terrigena]